MRKTLTSILLLATTAIANASFNPTQLKVNGLTSPLGIDTDEPTFSWETQSDERGFKQSAYEINVSTADGTPVWQSGKISSARQNQIRYEGKTLQSLTSYKWTLTIYDKDGNSSDVATSSFGTAFLQDKEWTAKWISAPKATNASVEIPLGVNCRYVKLDATKLGLAASTDARFYFLQLAEMEIYSNGENVARKATVSASDTWTVGSWNLNYLTDGIIVGSTLGYTTHQFGNTNQHVWIVADLGEAMKVDKIVLYPRQDDKAKSGTEAANFPSSYTIQTATEADNYTTNYTVTDGAAPSFVDNSIRIPYFGRNFNVAKDKTISRARLYATGLGVFTMTLNGKPVTDNVLEPGESEYEKTILYTTYDVTSLLNSGDNTIIGRLAGGLFNVDVLSGRYSKGEIKNSGTKAIKAELHIDYTDGTSDIIATDDSWRTTPSPTLGSNWWGGEDYDARLAINGIDNANYDVSGWTPVEVVDNPTFASSQAKGFGKLKARDYEPVRVVEEWKAVDVKSVYSGGYHLYVVDFGRNFAGQYRFNLKGKAGQVITLREGESLKADGSVLMENYYTGTADTYETYTFAGSEDGETWGPEFMYHGFRYLQIIGLDEAPSPSDFTAMRLRSNMDEVGEFKTSNQLLNDIHVICRDAIQSQLYNSITDCPQREKLGWLDVPNEMYNSLVYNYDMETFFQKVVLDCFDAQYANTGRVPSTVPHFMSVYDDDPNWGGSAILVPYRSWRQYGDLTTIAKYYSQMKQLMDYYTSKTTNGIMPGSSYSVLSDWGQETAGVSPLVPGEFTITTTYYYMLRAMAEIATELGYTADAEAFNAQADKTRTAFNTQYYKDGNYAKGRQSEQAMPLYYGLVDEANEALVAKKLAEQVKADGYKIKTGEIALKPLFMSLAKYGYNDVVYKMANQTDCPSYGWWVKQGYTTTPEYWDVGLFSQNHCMMDHIEEWMFSQLGGISNGGFGCDVVNIAPWIPEDMSSLNVSTHTIYGKVGCSWIRKSDNEITYTIEIPANSTAVVTLPCTLKQSVSENGQLLEAGSNGIIDVNSGSKEAKITLGSGTYILTVGPSLLPLVTIDENADFQNDEDKSNATVTLIRNIKADIWNSLVLPFSLTDSEAKAAFGEDVKIAKFSENSADASNATVDFTIAADASIDANIPVLIKTSTQGSEYVFTGRDVKATNRTMAKAEGTNFSFLGSYAATFTIPSGDYFVNNDKIFCSEGKTKLAGTRAYIAANNNEQGAKIAYFRIGNGETTGISNVRENCTERNYIWNISGQRINKAYARKGIYIYNNTKIVIN